MCSHACQIGVAQPNDPALRHLQSRDDAQQGGLAAPAGPEHTEQLALGDFEIDTVQHGGIAIARIDATQAQQGRH